MGGSAGGMKCLIHGKTRISLKASLGTSIGSESPYAGKQTGRGYFQERFLRTHVTQLLLPN